tara:strand:+ start:158 stop:421 length:264 start_codon:yes stop_codon:yes gene_type:complete
MKTQEVTHLIRSIVGDRLQKNDVRRFNDLRKKERRVCYKGMTQEIAEEVLMHPLIKEDGWMLYQNTGKFSYCGNNRTFGIKKYIKRI